MPAWVASGRHPLEAMRPRSSTFVLRHVNAGCPAPQGQNPGDRGLDLRAPKARNCAEQGSIPDRASDDCPAVRAGGMAVEAIITPARRVQIASSSSASPVIELARVDLATCQDASAHARRSTMGPQGTSDWAFMAPGSDPLGPGLKLRAPASKLRGPGVEAYKFEFRVTAPAGAHFRRTRKGVHARRAIRAAAAATATAASHPRDGRRTPR